MSQQRWNVVAFAQKPDMVWKQAQRSGFTFERSPLADIVAGDDAKKGRFPLTCKGEAIEKAIESFTRLQAANCRNRNSAGLSGTLKGPAHFLIEFGQSNYVWHHRDFLSVDAEGHEVVFGPMRVCDEAMGQLKHQRTSPP